MIRSAWVLFVLVAATVYYGTIAIGASLFGKRGALYSRLTQRWARAVLRAARTPVVAHGVENIRPGEPVVIVSNHVSWFDVFAIAAVLPVPFHFVAKSELERILLFGRAWKAAGHISIDRSDRLKAVLSLRAAAVKIRSEGSAVIVFAEGTRSRTGELQPFKKGAFLLAGDAAVPVVPTVVTGSYQIMRPDSWRIRPNPIHVHFQPAIDPRAPSSSASDALMEEVRRSMLEILEPAPAATGSLRSGSDATSGA